MEKVTKEYLLLFNAITDAEETLRRLQGELMMAQQRAEELFLDSGDGTGPGDCRGRI